MRDGRHPVLLCWSYKLKLNYEEETVKIQHLTSSVSLFQWEQDIADMKFQFIRLQWRVYSKWLFFFLNEKILKNKIILPDIFIWTNIFLSKTRVINISRS